MNKQTMKIFGYVVFGVIGLSLATSIYINYKTNKELKSLEPKTEE